MRGREYEQFVFEKFKLFFASGNVTKNDRIRGHLSGLHREIDVSVRITVENEQFLYIAQCKDWKTPADIKVLGEFSAVIQDVKAAKGFLLCSSGFAKSNHQYAMALGIELITVEDINSDKWKTDVQIPFLYIRKINNLKVALGITANQALVEKNRDRDLLIQITTGTPFTEDGGNTTIRYEDYINRCIESLGATLVIGRQQDICKQNPHILIADIWVPCSKFSLTLLSITKKYYLKYLKPDEYSHLRDHIRDATIPIELSLSNINLAFDESFVELSEEEPPVIPGLFFEVEEWTPVEQQAPVLS